jgi:hypothetical protein
MCGLGRRAVSAAQASSFAIAGQLSCLTEVQFGSALTRLYRFLRNPRFDN